MTNEQREPGGRNGNNYVTIREFDYRTATMDRRLDDHEKRIDELNDWKNRYAGPVVIIAGSLTMIATITNLLVIFGII